MKQATQKIKKLEALFRLTEEKKLATRALSPAQITELKSIMDFIKSEAPLPQSLIEWLAQLGLLYGVPFNNLVADERLLTSIDKNGKPSRRANLIRFFYLDMKWIDAMIDGALSIGTHNSKDFKMQQAVHKAFRPQIESEMLDIRKKIKGKPLIDHPYPSKMGTISGFIFRSPIVQQWPGLEIIGFKTPLPQKDYQTQRTALNDSDNYMEVLRMERLGADTLLMFFRGVPASILIKEPSEGTYSGFTYEEGADKYSLALRQLKGEDRIGEPLMDDDGTKYYTLQNDFRKDKKNKKDRRVLNITQLKESLEVKLSRETEKLTPKDMAVLFINSPRYYFYQKGAVKKFTLKKINLKKR